MNARAVLVRAAAVVAMATSCAMASSAPAPTPSCKGRALQGDAGNAAALLEQAMRGKKFDYNEAASLVGTESMLMQYYGMRMSLRSVADERMRAGVARISQLMQNDYVIAAQMALGAGSLRTQLPAAVAQPLAKYVDNATEPFHGDEELTMLSEQIQRAMVVTEGMSPRPRAFARWVMRAAAFDDAVALDAAMAGYCMSAPSAQDDKLLAQAHAIARLDRSKTYRDPAVFSGAQPDLNTIRKK